MTPPFQSSELACRLDEIQRYGILDTPPEQEYDDLVELAQSICGTPVALITLLDADRQWFKAKTGIEMEQLPIELSFCTHAITQPDLFVVPDLSLDARFSENPLVRFEPHARFYAGMPLITPNGVALGTICVLDRVPRELTETQMRALRALGRQTVSLLELRRSMARAERNMAERARVQAELRDSEAHLRASEGRLQIACRAGQIGLWESDLLTNRHTLNESNEMLFGLEPGTFGGSSEAVYSLVHPNDHEILRSAALHAIQNHEPMHAELRINRPDGETRWASITGEVAWDDGGNPTHISGAMIDITVQKRVREAISRLSRQNDLILKSVGEGIFGVDTNGIVTFLNPAAERSTGWSAAEVTGRLLHELIQGAGSNGAEQAANQCSLFQSVTSDQPCRVSSETFWKKDGTAFPVEYCSTPIYENGLQTGSVVTFQDISDRQKAEKALRSSEARFTAFMDNSPMLAFVKDDAGRYAYVNDTFKRAYGGVIEDCIGKTALDLWPGEVGEARQAEALASLKKDGLIEAVTDAHYPDGSIHKHHTNRFTFQDSLSRRFLGYMIFDITEKHRIEEENKAYMRQLEEAGAYSERQFELLQAQTEELSSARDMAVASVRTKSEFLANMSHEIRTPMNGVLGMIGLLLKTPLSVQQQHYARTVRQSAEGLLTVINDILDFSKIEAGKLTIENADFDLREAVEDVIDLLSPRAYEKGLEIACAMPVDFPHLLHGDSGRIRQILTNLVGNSIKFTERGEVTVRIEELCRTDDEAQLAITVQDTGIGIRSERQSAIFDSFTQADGSITRQYGGTGLGLAICQQLVTLMGGRIELISQFGVGSEFSITLTLKRQQGLPETDREDVLAGWRALIVDDNETNRRILSDQMLGWGCLCEEASSAAAGLERLQTAADHGETFQVVLLDVQMPVMSGLEMVQRVRVDARLDGTPIILVSSIDIEQTSVEQHAMNIAGVLSKPVRQPALLGALLHVAGWQPDLNESALATETTGETLGLHILLAEDNAINQEVAVAILEGWNCRVEVVDNGRKAIEAVRRGTFDVVLMDVQMPEVDGLQATDQIRKDEEGTGRHQPILAMTAHNMHGDREHCLSAGMDGYVAKPVSPDELLAALRPWKSAALPPAAPTSLAVAPVPVSACSILDWDRLHLSCGGKASLERRIMAEYLRVFPEGFDRLSQAMKSADPTAVRFEAHTIKGSSRTIGAEAVAAVSAELEERAKSGDLAPDLLVTLAAEWARLKELIETTLNAEEGRIAA